MTVWHSVLLEEPTPRLSMPIAAMEAEQQANEAAGRVAYERTRLLGGGTYPWEKLTSREKRQWCHIANPDLRHRL